MGTPTICREHGAIGERRDRAPFDAKLEDALDVKDAPAHAELGVRHGTVSPNLTSQATIESDLIEGARVGVGVGEGPLVDGCRQVVVESAEAHAKPDVDAAHDAEHPFDVDTRTREPAVAAWAVVGWWVAEVFFGVPERTADIDRPRDGARECEQAVDPGRRCVGIARHEHPESEQRCFGYLREHDVRR